MYDAIKLCDHFIANTPKKLIEKYYTDDLSPLTKIQLKEITLEGFNGNLSPLKGMGLQKKSFNRYDGDPMFILYFNKIQQILWIRIWMSFD